MEEENTAAAVAPASTGAPAAGGGEPAPAPEPTVAPAPEPAAAAPDPADVPEPANVAPAPAPYEAFGWDEWDGTPDALPEDVRGWYEKFNERTSAEVERAKAEMADALAAAEDQAKAWKRMYEASWQGEEDPRIAELSEKADTYERAFEAFQKEKNAEIEAFQKEVETAADEVYEMVAEAYPDVINENMSKELADNLIKATETGIPLARAAKYAQMGEDILAMAIEVVGQGATPEVVERIIDAEQRAGKKGTTPRKPSPAASVVAGANPAETPARVPNKVDIPTDRAGRLAAIARRAIEKAHRV